MILYLHGFNSSALSKKSLLLQSKIDKVIAPNLNWLKVSSSLDALENILKEFPIDTVIGASLGGFYAHYLCKKHDKRLLLINPVVNPLDYIDQVSLEENDKIEMITAIEALLLFNEKHDFSQELEVLFGMGDDSVDYKKSREVFKSYPCKYYDDDHSLLKGFKDYLEQNNTLLLKYF